MARRLSLAEWKIKAEEYRQRAMLAEAKADDQQHRAILAEARANEYLADLKPQHIELETARADLKLLQSRLQTSEENFADERDTVRQVRYERDHWNSGYQELKQHLAADEELLSKQRERIIALTGIGQLAESLARTVLLEHLETIEEADGSILGIPVRRRNRPERCRRIIQSRELLAAADAFEADFGIGLSKK